MSRDRRRSLFLGAVLIGIAVCIVSAEAACPDGCSCLNSAKASAAGYTYCDEKQTVCDKDSAGNLLYCFERPVTLAKVTCPLTCSCLETKKYLEAGYQYCGGNQKVCGKDSYGNPLSCFEKPVTPAPVQEGKACPSDCVCTDQAKASAAGYTSYCGGEKKVCGKDTDGNSLYCYGKPITPAPVQEGKACPSDCVCTDEAKARAAGYTSYCDGVKTVCSKDATGNTLYCYGKPITPAPVQEGKACPSDCVCTDEAKASAAGYMSYCDGVKTACSKDAAGNTLFCYEKPATEEKTMVEPVGTVMSLTCAKGCECLDAVMINKTGYQYCGKKKTQCGIDAARKPRYCFEKLVTKAPTPLAGVSSEKPVVSVTPEKERAACSAGCICLIPSDATARGLSYCGGKQTECTDPLTGLSGGPTETKENRYCYAMPGAKTASLVPERVKQKPIPVPVDCPSGCSCLDEATIRTKGYPSCSSERTECGYSKTVGTMYCARTEVVPGGASGPAPAIATGPVRNVFSAISELFASLFFGTLQRPPTDDYSQIITSYCRERFGLDQCGDGCVNLSTDTDNCGSCGNWCRETEQCDNGRCVDLQSDPNHCGGLGNVCPAGAPCVNGYCSALGCLDSRMTDCNNSCVNLSTDTDNCGECGNACPTDEFCGGGVCRRCLPFADLYCAQRYRSGSMCTNVSIDENHCGRCQHACSLGQACLDGVCVGCRAGTAMCGDECFDLDTSKEHCGSCDHQCAPDQTCVAGTCTCPAGTTMCGYYCFDLDTSEEHCGGCGVRCVSGLLCVAGHCCPEGYDWIDPVCRPSCPEGLHRECTGIYCDCCASGLHIQCNDDICQCV